MMGIGKTRKEKEGLVYVVGYEPCASFADPDRIVKFLGNRARSVESRYHHYGSATVSGKPPAVVGYRISMADRQFYMVKATVRTVPVELGSETLPSFQRLPSVVTATKRHKVELADRPGRVSGLRKHPG